MTKRHVKDFFETTKEEKNAIFELVDKAKSIIDEKYKPTGYNIGMNCGVLLGTISKRLDTIVEFTAKKI